MKVLRLAFVAAFACAAFADPVSAQNTYTWANTGANMSAPGSWAPTGTPVAGDAVLFAPAATSPATVVQPVVDANLSLGSLTLAPNPMLGGWTFSGSSTLTIGGSANTVVIAYGPATYTFDGPTIQGTGSVNDLLQVTSGSALVLRGNSAAAGSLGQTQLTGGTLVLDNSGTNLANRLPSSGLTFRSGTLDLRGNVAGTAFTLGSLSGLAGVNTIRLTPNGGPLSVNFANAGAFSTRPSSASVFRVEAASGVLGGPGANDPKMTFTGTPFLGPNGLLANTTDGPTVGHYLVSDANGTDFATWNATDGVKAAGATLTSSSVAGGIAAGTASDRVFFTPGTGTQSATSTITNGSLRITPTASGGVLAMGTNTLATVALMLDGDRDFTISGTGPLGPGSVARYIHVSNPNTTLTTSLVIASGDGPTNVVGPGFVVLNGTASQNTLGNVRINLLGGTLRANNTQLGFASSSTNGVLAFSGGVLEIQGGGSFTRSLGTSGGNVRWEGGSGGFSAFGANAAVNIGNGASLTWGQANFVGDGYALKFGSTQSNATLTWQNPIALDNGAATNYLLREIGVTRGAGTAADKTVITGVISGSASTDLIKTGNGVLELGGVNTYRGNTLVHGGTLVLGGSSTLGTGGSLTGNVVVGRGATFAGTGTVNPDAGKSVFVNPGGAIRGGNPTLEAERLGTLTLNSDLTISSTATDRGTLRVEVSRTGAGTADSSKIAITGNQLFHLNPGTGNSFLIDLVPGANALQPGESYQITLATVEVAGNVRLNGTGIQNATVGPSNYALQSSAFAFTNVSLAVDEGGQNLTLSFMVAPVPEPATVLGLAALVGLGAGLRRRRRGP